MDGILEQARARARLRESDVKIVGAVEGEQIILGKS
jgi:hypothetical protein